jgi:TfoX/Sxy family transcriptional regulator of competence genes
MQFKKSPPELIELFSKIAPTDPAVEHRKMFGWPCCFVKGNMFTGLHQDDMILRLSDEDRARFLALDGAREFEPMPGHKMREYAVVPKPMLARTAELRKWVDKSLEYAKSLPEKAKKKKSAAAAKKTAAGSRTATPRKAAKSKRT